MALPNLPSLPGLDNVTTAVPASSDVTSAAAQSVLGSIPGVGDIMNVGSTLKSDVAGAYNTAKSEVSFFTNPTRVATAIVGIILIGVGLIMFKPVMNVVTGAAKKGAILAA